MKVLVLGANGATGKHVVDELLKRNIDVRAVIRSGAILPREIWNNPRLDVRRANVTDLREPEVCDLLRDCTAMVSCLGHNITLRGILGKPRRLITDTVRKFCEAAAKSSNGRMKFILMSTTACTNASTGEKNSFGERIIFSILKLLLPPHADNVAAADYLHKTIGANNEKIRWTAVRPDTLVDEETGGEYNVCEAPVRSPIFDAGTTNRAHVGQFFAELLAQDALWQQWQGKMPVIYTKQK